MNKVFAIVVAISLFLMSGCTSSDPILATSADDIIGIFASTGGATYARFDEDGTFRLGPSLMLVTNEPPITPPGEYWFEGEQLHLKPDDDPICDNITAVYEVQPLDSGNLRFVANDDACDHRMVVLQGVIDSETGEPSTTWVPVE